MKKENLEVILEDMNSKFDVLIEGHQLLNKKIDDSKDELGKKISEVDAKVGFVHQHLNKKIDDTKDELVKKIDEVDTKVEFVHRSLKGEIREVKAEIMVIGERLEEHEERFVRLERRA